MNLGNRQWFGDELVYILSPVRLDRLDIFGTGEHDPLHVQPEPDLRALQLALQVEAQLAVQEVVEQHGDARLAGGVPAMLRVDLDEQCLQLFAGRAANQRQVWLVEQERVHAFDVGFVVDVDEDVVVWNLYIFLFVHEYTLQLVRNYFVVFDFVGFDEVLIGIRLQVLIKVFWLRNF